MIGDKLFLVTHCGEMLIWVLIVSILKNLHVMFFLDYYQEKIKVFKFSQDLNT